MSCISQKPTGPTINQPDPKPNIENDCKYVSERLRNFQGEQVETDGHQI